MNWKRFFTTRKIIIYIVVLAVGGFGISRVFGGNGTDNIITDTVRRQDLKKTVLATGQVVSDTDLSLSFKSSGRVSRVNVRVGQQVRSGAILATLDQAAELASVKSAQGAVASARANLSKVLEGARTEEVAVAEAALNAAKVTLANTTADQNVLVENAYRSLLSGGLEAQVVSQYDSNVDISVTGIYSGSTEGDISISLMPTGNTNFYYQATGLVNYTGLVERGKALPLGSTGLFINFGTSGSLLLSDRWVISIPNKLSSSYITNYNAYQSALGTRTTAITNATAIVQQREADLALKKAAAKPSEVEAANAQVLSAEGQLATALSSLENTVIHAPGAGTITKVDIKIGEVATAQTPVLTLQDVENLYVEANISEANIAALRVEQSAEITFDALGSDKVYQGTVKFVEPASTLVSGVVNYKIRASIPKTQDILPGMTASLVVVTSSQTNVLVIPERSVVDRDAKKFVRVVTDSQKKTFTEQEVQLGAAGDGGLVAVTSGVDEGQEIVTSIVQP